MSAEASLGLGASGVRTNRSYGSGGFPDHVHFPVRVPGHVPAANLLLDCLGQLGAPSDDPSDTASVVFLVDPRDTASVVFLVVIAAVLETKEYTAEFQQNSRNSRNLRLWPRIASRPSRPSVLPPNNTSRPSNAARPAGPRPRGPSTRPGAPPGPAPPAAASPLAAASRSTNSGPIRYHD
jgi:hypothetical protein